MRRTNTVGVGFLLVALLPELVLAQTVYSDGAAHTVSSTNSGPIEITNDGTTLNVIAPAVVSGSFGVQGSTAIVGQASTIINMIGGQVAGLENKSLIGPGITSYGLFSSFGGLVMGGFSTGLGGATGVNVFGSAVIGAGVIQGGAGVEGPGGIGLNLVGSALIFDGAIRGGISKGLGSTPGAAIVSSAGSDLSVQGGTFQGGVKLGGSAEIAGGTFQSTLPNGPSLQNVGTALSAAKGSDLSISGGTFQGNAPSKSGGDGYAALQAVDPHSFSISGGSFQGDVQVVLSSTRTASISGGLFSGIGQSGGNSTFSFSGFDQAALTVSGGVFSDTIDLDLSSASSASFIGSGLVFDLSTHLLTGTLGDGSAINSYIELDNSNTMVSYGYTPDGEETLTFGFGSVPEPSSIVMFGMGVAAVAIIFARKRLRGAMSSSEVAWA
jgi:hypothetical protein